MADECKEVEPSAVGQKLTTRELSEWCAAVAAILIHDLALLVLEYGGGLVALKINSSSSEREYEWRSTNTRGLWRPGSRILRACFNPTACDVVLLMPSELLGSFLEDYAWDTPAGFLSEYMIPIRNSSIRDLINIFGPDQSPYGRWVEREELEQAVARIVGLDHASPTVRKGVPLWRNAQSTTRCRMGHMSCIWLRAYLAHQPDALREELEAVERLVDIAEKPG